MPKPTIPHDAYVFIGDGQKALFLRNEGDEKFPNLVTEQVFAEKDPPTHLLGTDRPGREFSAAHSTIRSAIEPTDWHRIEEDRFVKSVCEAFERLVRERNRIRQVLGRRPGATLVTATDGNHGRAVARMAAHFGVEATVFVPILGVHGRM